MDLIDRQAAIEAINHICPVDTEYDCTLLDRVDVRCVLSDLPSVEPERKKGKWVKLYSGDTFHCRLCGSTFMVLQGKDSMNYCPNCGAEMEVQE